MADEKQAVLQKLKQLSGHTYVQCTERGNVAIDRALEQVKQLTSKKQVSKNILLIPDQGGWLHYLKAPQRFGFEVVKIKTNQSKLDLADLESKAPLAAGILIQSLAGYFVEQPMKDIIEICKKHGCLVIEDVSGSIDLLPCHAVDYKVCSFGKDKPINLGVGGFVSSNTILPEEHADLDYGAILAKITALKSRIAFLTKQAQKIKRDLVHQTILYPNSKAINVIVAFGNQEEKKFIIDYCNAHILEYTLCPRYIRVDEPAVSIEVKRLTT
jgi:selenocysteine lyase/cysteine desulfurase